MNMYKKIKNKNIYTDDNWQTIKNEKNSSEKYVDELNADVVSMILIRVKFGEQKANLIKNEFLQIRKLLKEICNTDSLENGFGLEFEIFAIAVLHNMDYETVIKYHIIHGSDDGAVDAIVWDDTYIYVYQIKMGTIKSSDKNKMEENISEFMQNSEIERLSSNNTKHLLNFLKKYKENIYRKEVKFLVISTNSSGYDYKTNDIYKQYFRQILLPMRENNLKLFLPIENRKVSCRTYVSNVAKIDKKIYIFTIKASELKNAIKLIHGLSKGKKLYKLFYDNVRGSLGDNKSIRETIFDEKERKYFIDYNNGITLTGEAKFIELSGIEITNPVVSNGQQTITNLMNVENDNLLKDINVIVFVKDTTESFHPEQKKLKQKIAKYTNTQTAIKPIDILSLDASIRDIQEEIYRYGEDRKDKFGNIDGYFLDIYSNGKKEYDEIVKKLYDKNKIIDLSLNLLGFIVR